MAAYYNENNPYCVEWLRNLIQKGLIAKGEVDDRSIKDVQPEDLKGFTQGHFFAGIGLWSYSLRRAGWDDSRPVWSGSCPCQGFSVSGKRKGFEDPRHLWPEWRRLIDKCLPATVVGEQVTGYPAWLCLVRSDLEALGYAVGAIPVEAASAGADHFRERYWFVADKAMAYADDKRPQISLGQSGNTGAQRTPIARDRIRDVVNTAGDGWGERWSEHEFRSRGFSATVASIEDRQYVECPDGKWRRLPPSGVRWLGVRLNARILKLCAIGNAIDPRPATAFIRAFMESQNVQ